VQVKNRESAARSRARKQEYTLQLETQVAQLQEENRILLEKVNYTKSYTPSRDLSLLPKAYLAENNIRNMRQTTYATVAA
jgi:hypothetical protein